jgi:DNA-binding MarR family transcriptional regulator
MPNDCRHQYIMSGLLEAWDWFDNSLQNVLRDRGYPPLNKSQSMMMMYVSIGIKRPSEIARKMRLSRQAIAHIADQLISMELIHAREDPTDGRSKILEFSATSKRERVFAEETIQRLEWMLAKRIGSRKVSSLLKSLNADWGDPVKSNEELRRAGPGSNQESPKRVVRSR